MTTPPTDPIMQMSSGQLIDLYVQFRDALQAEQKAFEARKAKTKTVMDRISSQLMVRMNADGLQNLKGNGLTAYIHQDYRYTCGDWNALHDYVQATGNFDLLQKRVGKNAMQQMFEETGTLPPGVQMDAFREVRIRKS